MQCNFELDTEPEKFAIKDIIRTIGDIGILTVD